MDDTPVWLVTRYEEVRAVLRDPRFVNSPHSLPERRGGQDPRDRLMEVLGIPEEYSVHILESVLTSDPPDHTRLRRLVSRAFTARRIPSLRPRVEEITDKLLDALPGHADEYGVVDLIEHFAYPLPITVICELVGVPEVDRPRWRDFGSDLASLEPERIATSFPAMVGHLRELIAERRAEPRDDLITTLIRAQDDDGGRLSDTEMITLVMTLVLAGHETTAHLIGNGTVALLTHPDQLRLLKEDGELLPHAVHELMRRCGPVQMTQLRYAAQDVELAGTRIRQGEAVQPVLVSANHDPRHYDHPERLDLTRQSAGRGEDHVGFGHGTHYCLGASLARQEAEVAIGRLLRRHPDLSLAVAPDQLKTQVRRRQPGAWRLLRLPLRLTPMAQQ
ncbi:cytochrome P450 family protein [Streptomyces iconiensis]|uniref:Cytochrome P450 n=1 Tax=Streptomyces iconiensis TaxID=1384038 RepID=A0ABT6ZSK7_9ACTN|nr:cytochrome P450 [Streptomyces iconiensis]MDJ1132049.1 cytochrome P450 [Streptomyces iconiensis]